VRAFWLGEYAGYSDHFRAEAISPIQNKIGKALIEPRLRNMLAQPKSTITLRRLMDEGAIVICNLAKGRLGEGTSHLLGALLTTTIAQAALSRADVPAAERRVFHLYADEFQSFATDSFALILSEARKYGLTLTVAHQYLEQLPDKLRAAVFGNVGSMLACRTGASDAADICRADRVGRRRRAARSAEPHRVGAAARGRCADLAAPAQSVSGAASPPCRCNSAGRDQPAPFRPSSHRRRGAHRPFSRHLNPDPPLMPTVVLTRVPTLMPMMLPIPPESIGIM
jgi:hypothetical protein